MKKNRRIQFFKLRNIRLIVMLYLTLSYVASTGLVWATDISGEHGILHVYGELVDSPCELSMLTADQTVNLGTLTTKTLKNFGDRSSPVSLAVQLDGCMLSAGEYYSKNWKTNHPKVNLSFIGAPDFSDPSLLKVTGAKGIALRLLDRTNQSIRLGPNGISQILDSGHNQLIWKIVAERTADIIIPGPFSAYADFRLNYD
jgi:type 1 fimbria pilin